MLLLFAVLFAIGSIVAYVLTLKKSKENPKQPLPWYMWNIWVVLAAISILCLVTWIYNYLNTPRY